MNDAPKTNVTVAIKPAAVIFPKRLVHVLDKQRRIVARLATADEAISQIEEEISRAASYVKEPKGHTKNMARAKIRNLGFELHAIGGEWLMLEVIQRVAYRRPLRRDIKRTGDFIDYAWRRGVGRWETMMLERTAEIAARRAARKAAEQAAERQAEGQGS